MKHSHILVLVLVFCACINAAQIIQVSSFDTTYNGVTFTQTRFNFTQQLDHFHPGNTTTWFQRFTVYNTTFKPDNGIVFVSIGGESAMKGISQGRSWLLQLCQQYNGMVISVEHRFYGQSQPFGFGADAYSTSNLSYLTADQALEDLAEVVQAFQSDPTYMQFFGTSRRNAFITYGGSYPGAMSAWFRAKYPHLTAGALASSAVVNAIVNFQEYDYQVYLSTKEVNPNCPGNILAFNNAVNTTMYGNDVDAINTVKTQFNATSLSNIEFLYYVADIQASLVQYGNATGLCAIYDSTDYAISLANQLASLSNAQGFISPPVGYSVADLQVTAYSEIANQRQWQYQVCTYYGWLQTANDFYPMRSKTLTINYFLNQCIQIFGPNFLPSQYATNGYWGGKQIEATNIVFTNGSQDPWKWASLLLSQRGMTAIVTECIDCAHGCEMGITTNPTIIKTQDAVSALFASWQQLHRDKYFNVSPTPSPAPSSS